jgi:hypothetical protein
MRAKAEVEGKGSVRTSSVPPPVNFDRLPFLFGTTPRAQTSSG